MLLHVAFCESACDAVIQVVCTVVFKMQNCSDGVNSDCIAAYPGEEWKCFFPQVN